MTIILTCYIYKILLIFNFFRKTPAEKHVKFEDNKIWKNSAIEILRKNTWFLTVILINLKVTKIYLWYGWWQGRDPFPSSNSVKSFWNVKMLKAGTFAISNTNVIYDKLKYNLDSYTAWKVSFKTQRSKD